MEAPRDESRAITVDCLAALLMRPSKGFTRSDRSLCRTHAITENATTLRKRRRATRRCLAAA